MTLAETLSTVKYGIRVEYGIKIYKIRGGNMEAELGGVQRRVKAPPRSIFSVEGSILAMCVIRPSNQAGFQSHT